MSVTREQLHPYISEAMSEEQISALIEKHVNPTPHGSGIHNACLNRTGTSVAAIIADLEAEKGDVHQAAVDFSATAEEILAAVFFYWRNKDVIDAEITLRRSGFMS